MAKPIKASKQQKWLEEYYAIVNKRFKIGKEVYDSQDNLTKEALDRIVDRLERVATGVINIGDKPVKIDREYINKNILFIATEILGDLALANIQVANFKFHPAWCSECKKPLHFKKGGKVKKARKTKVKKAVR